MPMVAYRVGGDALRDMGMILQLFSVVFFCKNGNS